MHTVKNNPMDHYHIRNWIKRKKKNPKMSGPDIFIGNLYKTQINR